MPVRIPSPIRKRLIAFSGSPIHRVINVMLLVIITTLTLWISVPAIRNKPSYTILLLTGLTAIYGALYWAVFIYRKR